MKVEKTHCDRCGKEVHPRSLFNLKGKPFKTVVSQTVAIPGNLSWPFHSDKSFDLCYDCVIELRKFLNIDERTSIPHTNYRPCNDTVFYLCDRKACKDCVESCKYTSDIRHAISFFQPYIDSDDGSCYVDDKQAYFEIEMSITYEKEKENASRNTES